MMGVGTNVLGYSNKVVDQEVKKTISKGNLSTFNSLEEVILAERLIKIHPWAKKLDLQDLVERQMQLQSELQELIQKKIILLFVVIMVGMIGIYQLI